MLNQVKKQIIRQLWDNYAIDLPEVSHIQTALYHVNEILLWDHFAIIDLPGPHTGIRPLTDLFSQLDYEIRGQDYLSEKQNDFAWLAEKSVEACCARKALPQIVVADFRREALVPEVRKIIDAYALQSQPLDSERLNYLKKRVLKGDKAAVHGLVNLVINYLKGRDWPLPTVKEFETVKNTNELLAWVLIMGRQVNHFAWAIHLSRFKNLKTFNQFISKTLKIPLNKKGGIIKGQLQRGIAQSSTTAMTKFINLCDGRIYLPDRFIEFVWRYAVIPDNEKPSLWKDYFTGFVANQADRVVESLYIQP